MAPESRRLSVGVPAIFCLLAAVYWWHTAVKDRPPVADRETAISRAAGINVALLNFVQAHGRSEADQMWLEAVDEQERYEFLKPYLAHTPTDYREFQPVGYSITLPDQLFPIKKVRLRRELSFFRIEEIYY